MRRLRAPGGCPWDREQTFDTIKKYTLEETYEVLEAIEGRAWTELRGELGDLLLQVLFYAEMAEEDGLFNIDDVIDGLSTKLVARHPHVFGEVKADDSETVIKNWEALKREERKGHLPGKQEAEEGLLDGVSSRFPALLEAQKLSSKAAHVGFDWPGISGLFDKLGEETAELKQQLERVRPGTLEARGRPTVPPELSGGIEDEIGDLFFVLVNLARYVAVDPESALRSSNRKFRRRFGWMEQQLKQDGQDLDGASLEQMETLWQRAKKLEEEPR